MPIAVSCFLTSKDSTSEALKRWLRAGADRLGPGQRLPATRAIVQAWHVSPLTVSGALADLSREGVVVTRPGAGTYAAEPQHRRAGGPAGYWWQTVALADRAVDTAGLSPLADPPQADDVISLAAGPQDSGEIMPGPALPGGQQRGSTTNWAEGQRFQRRAWALVSVMAGAFAAACWRNAAARPKVWPMVWPASCAW
jgi:DNA-binding transcriptional MocR family regulator